MNGGGAPPLVARGPGTRYHSIFIVATELEMALTKLLALAAGTFWIAGALHAAAPNMTEGLWEITMKMDMPGMPGGAQPRTMQQCVTKKDIENPQRIGGNADPGSAKCQATDHRTQGNTTTWKMSCTGPNPMSGTGSITYNGNAFTSNTQMTMTRGGKPVTMAMNYSGKYLGPCKK